MWVFSVRSSIYWAMTYQHFTHQHDCWDGEQWKKTLNYSLRCIVISLLQAEETAEALDAAAVEAALSLCEESVHALSGAWEAGPFQPHESHYTVPTGVPHSLQSSLEGKTEVLEVHGGTSASLSSLRNSQDNCLAAFPMGLRVLSSTSSTSCNSKSLEHCYIGAPSQPEAMRHETGDMVHQKISMDVTIKCERKKWAQQRPNNHHEGLHIHA